MAVFKSTAATQFLVRKKKSATKHPKKHADKEAQRRKSIEKILSKKK